MLVFSKGPAWTANMEVTPGHVPAISDRALFTSLSSLPLSTSSPSSHRCSDCILPFGVPQTCQGHFHFRTLTWLFAMPGMIFDQIYFALSLYLGLHEDKAFLHCLTSKPEIQEHPPNFPNPSSPALIFPQNFLLSKHTTHLSKVFVCLPQRKKKKYSMNTWIFFIILSSCLEPRLTCSSHSVKINCMSHLMEELGTQTCSPEST